MTDSSHKEDDEAPRWVLTQDSVEHLFGQTLSCDPAEEGAHSDINDGHSDVNSDAPSRELQPPKMLSSRSRQLSISDDSEALEDELNRFAVYVWQQVNSTSSDSVKKLAKSSRRESLKSRAGSCCFYVKNYGKLAAGFLHKYSQGSIEHWKHNFKGVAKDLMSDLVVTNRLTKRTKLTDGSVRTVYIFPGTFERSSTGGTSSRIDEEGEEDRSRVQRSVSACAGVSMDLANDFGAMEIEHVEKDTSVLKSERPVSPSDQVTRPHKKPLQKKHASQRKSLSRQSTVKDYPTTSSWVV